MYKPFIRHDNLRKTIEELLSHSYENTPDDVFERFINELKHSYLIIAADMSADGFDFQGFEDEGKDYGVLFTDMDEFRKTFSDDESGSQPFVFEVYKSMVEENFIDGFVINPGTESFLMKKDLFSYVSDLPKFDYNADDSYSTEELIKIRDNIDNSSLERFISDPSNIGRYEELFERISNSVLLTLMVSREDLSGSAVDGVIKIDDPENPSSLYKDEIGGKYATAYTSQKKMENVETGMNNYYQIINFSFMTNFVLNEDMDGIIINPGLENIILTRDVLLQYSSLLEKTCDDSRLNSGIFHLFMMEC